MLDSDGSVDFFTANTPAINGFGIHLYGSYTNLLLRSNSLTTTSSWTALRTTVTAAATTDAQRENILGGTLLAVEQYDRAREHLERAISLDANLAAAHNNLGIILRMRGEKTRAAEAARTNTTQRDGPPTLKILAPTASSIWALRTRKRLTP